MFDESASWYEPETIPTSTPIDAESAEQELQDGDRLEHMFKESPITTRLSGPQEPPSDQSTSRPNSTLDKGKPKMKESKKALTSANEKLCRSTHEKSPVSRFDYNDYMAYHYAFMMNVATVHEPEKFSAATKDLRWIEAMNEEMQELCKNEILDLVPTSPHKKAIRCRWI